MSAARRSACQPTCRPPACSGKASRHLRAAARYWAARPPHRSRARAIRLNGLRNAEAAHSFSSVAQLPRNPRCPQWRSSKVELCADLEETRFENLQWRQPGTVVVVLQKNRIPIQRVGDVEVHG